MKHNFGFFDFLEFVLVYGVTPTVLFIAEGWYLPFVFLLPFTHLNQLQMTAYESWHASYFSSATLAVDMSCLMAQYLMHLKVIGTYGFDDVDQDSLRPELVIAKFVYIGAFCICSLVRVMALFDDTLASDATRRANAKLHKPPEYAHPPQRFNGGYEKVAAGPLISRQAPRYPQQRQQRPQQVYYATGGGGYY